MAWTIFLFLALVLISFPIQRVLLVFCAYGRDAYFHHGIRVLPGKPARFSDGTLVPQWMDIIAGIGMFYATILGMSLAMIMVLRFYERHFGKA